MRNAFVISSLGKGEPTKIDANTITSTESTNTNSIAKNLKFKAYNKKLLEKILNNIDLVKVGSSVVE